MLGRRPILVVLAFLLVLCASANAFAESGSASQCRDYQPLQEGTVSSDEWALNGVECFNEGAYLPALISYRKAYRSSRSELLLAALGRTLQELRQPALARPYYLEFLKRTPVGESRTRIEQRLGTIDQQLANAHRVRFVSSPPGVNVYVVMQGSHWESIGETPVSMPLLEGTYTFAFHDPAHHTEVRTTRVTSEDTLSVSLIPHSALFRTTSKELHRRALYVGLVATPVLFGGAAVLWIGSSDEERARQDLWQRPSEYKERLDDAYSLQNLGVGLIATGATLGVVAGSMAVLSWFWDPGPVLKPRVSADGSLTFRF